MGERVGHPLGHGHVDAVGARGEEREARHEHEGVVDADAEQHEGQHRDDEVVRDKERGEAEADADGHAARGEPGAHEREAGAQHGLGREGHQAGVDCDEGEAEGKERHVTGHGGICLAVLCTLRDGVDRHCGGLPADRAVGDGAQGGDRVDRPLGPDQVVHLRAYRACAGAVRGQSGACAVRVRCVCGACAVHVTCCRARWVRPTCSSHARLMK